MLKRSISLLKQKQLDLKFSESITADNIETTSRVQLYLIFKNTSFIEKNAYLHNVISKWWETKTEDEINLRKLRKLIKKSRIELNDLERDNILSIEERVFSIDRHVKEISVNARMLKKESVVAKYTNAIIYIEENRKLITLAKGDLYISNLRIMLSANNLRAFRFDDIASYNLSDYGFKFIHKDKAYVLRIHDTQTLNHTMVNIMKKKNKGMYMRKDNYERN